MKFSIRFADQVVGTLIILALGILIFVIFMLGSSQRWFSRDYYFYTYFPSASGLSQNMAVQYKGFTIGRVKSIRLDENDQVEVRFSIFDTYIDRVRNGSLVEIIISPLAGLGGNQFVFYPGTGTELLSEGDTIPVASSPEGRQLLAVGLAQRPERDDSVSNIINSIGNTLADLNSLIVEVQDAFVGTDKTSLGRTMAGVEGAATGLQVMAEKLPSDFEEALDRIMVQLEPLLINLRDFSEKLDDPDGSISAILDSDGDVYQDLVKSLDALSGTLKNLEEATDFLPAQIPRIAVVINDLHTTIEIFEDVLIALINNPLLKKGVPEHSETKPGGVHIRDMEF
jgi:phospholipid/cholesterol/gamma-HCH transport system substrate-binding protein